jgi:hypothetical protein
VLRRLGEGPVLGATLAALRQVPHIELDALHWQANWTEAPLDVFRARIAQAVAGETWTLDGNYSKARDIVGSAPIPSSDRLLAGGHSLRLIRRTAPGAWREELWNGNRETRRGRSSAGIRSVVGAQDISQAAQGYPELFAQPEYQHLTVIRLRSPRKAEQWLMQTLRPTAGEGRALRLGKRARKAAVLMARYAA